MERIRDYWPHRLYGPSNYQERKPQLVPAGVVIDEGRQFVRMEFWFTWNLAREQSRKAFENGEISPDALMHVTSVIRDAIGKSAQPDNVKLAQEKLLRDTRIHDLIIWGLVRSMKIPHSYLIHEGHPSLTEQGMDGEKLLRFLFDSGFRVDQLNFYLWENLDRLLLVTAKYLDSRRRVKKAPIEDHPDLPN